MYRAAIVDVFILLFKLAYLQNYGYMEKENLALTSRFHSEDDPREKALNKAALKNAIKDFQYNFALEENGEFTSYTKTEMQIQDVDLKILNETERQDIKDTLSKVLNGQKLISLGGKQEIMNYVLSSRLNDIFTVYGQPNQIQK